MHMDNPLALANLIINDLIPDANEPVKTVEEYRQMGMSIDNIDYQAMFDKDLSFLEKGSASDSEPFQGA